MISLSNNLVLHLSCNQYNYWQTLCSYIAQKYRTRITKRANTLLCLKYKNHISYNFFSHRVHRNKHDANYWQFRMNLIFNGYWEFPGIHKCTIKSRWFLHRTHVSLLCDVFRTGKVKGLERFMGTVENMEPQLMETTSGQAKYEHQHRAIVWRMPRLPKEGQGTRVYLFSNILFLSSRNSFYSLQTETRATDGGFHLCGYAVSSYRDNYARQK